MPSRPQLGVQQRQPPSRSLSAQSSLSQRPAHQRSLSNQYLPPSPVRNNAAAADFPATGPATSAAAGTTASADSSQSANAAQTQYGTPRRGPSRLRLELANDNITHSGFVESPTGSAPLDLTKSFTPSRVMPPSMTDASDIGDMSSPRTSRGGQTVDDINTPLPYPRRRCRFALPDAKKVVPASGPASVKRDSNRDNRPKPYKVEIPAGAPRYLLLGGAKDAGAKTSSKDPQARVGSAKDHPMGYADFAPWSGDGPEDHFTQAFIQNGYFDKIPVGQAETNSAKGAIFPSLKHKTGLYALSTVFSGLLASRRHNGQITAPSTFKPPPRATLTDTKREAWLKELANPTTSLRKLSRTIPHGIRGKGLLEQCLNKSVPTDRAVWLAKCVGALEIRAFKRKGMNSAIVMGGEAKWIRDWTVFVEQFVDGVISSFGDSDWKTKVNYATRLATHLYAEHLLDREHYMEWLVSGLENCPHSKLPMYLLIVQIYWRDLLRLRKYGRRLVAALLTHYTTIHTHPDRDVFAPLSTRLLLLIKSLMTTTAVNFVSPSTWPKHRDALAASLSADEDIYQAAYRLINHRNEQLLSSVRAPPAARQGLVKLLDGALYAPISDDLVAKYQSLSQDQISSIRTILEWCTSLYRPGTSKIYVAHRLLSSSATAGVDITQVILEFMVSDPLEQMDRKTSLYHLVSELVRSCHFDSMRYIQWLIACGGLHDSNGVRPDGPATSRLLVELPTSDLPDSLKTMRANMLGRAAYSVDDEATDTAMAIDCVKNSLGLYWAPTQHNASIPIDKLCKKIKKSSRPLKSGVGQCLREVVIVQSEFSLGAGKEGLQFPMSTFVAVRSILEAAEDFQTLAEYLKTMSALFDADILSSCADTLNLHLPTFGALGVVKDLFDTLAARLGHITQTQGILAVRPLLPSMAMLAPRIPGQEQLVNHLTEMIRNDRNNAVDASSPVSDNMAARIQDEEGELLDEIEKRLANKTSMDRTTMNSFLNKIIPKIQACWDKADERLRAYGALLARLRHFDTPHFDSFMTKWVLGVRNPQNRPPLAQIFPLMVSVGCLNFSIVLTTTSDAVSSRPNMTGKPARPSTYVQEVLELLTAPPTAKEYKELLTPEEVYRFQILQNQAPKTHFKELVALVRNALTEYCASLGQAEAPNVPLASPKAQDRLIDLLRTLVLTEQVSVPKLLALKTADPAVGKMMDDITTRLLFPNDPPGRHFTFEQILGLANEFTLPFCHLKLSQCMATVEATGVSPQERLQTTLEVYAKAMDDAIDSRNITWTGILPSLPTEVTQHLLNRAQARLFDLLPSTKTGAPTDGNFSVAETLLSVIDTITRGQPTGSRPATQLAPTTVDRLADLWELLASPVEAEVKIAVLTSWLPLMLSYLALHASNSDTANKSTSEVRGRALLVLSGLLQELESLSSLAVCDARVPFNLVPQLTQRIFDLALLFVDTLPDDVRQTCIRHLRDSLADSRLKYIFSWASTPHLEMMLAHKEKSGGARQRVPGFLGHTSMGQNIWGMPVNASGAGEKLSTFTYRRWEILNEPTPNVGENDTSLSLTLFEAIKLQ
ncbi:RNA polymerase II mediator complex subunit [Gnomoniopsis smithogilvyi]|uniref:Mediator of RNA polymerase II transcription subunit 12 n=1 Tax=Gnomoniopsis smithogilvyi TaxID=1191159 RepID=A0A9W8YLV5_9PEZI|nr:RNA polymerase II mediator complex subunit [Gnomoniopsis smithogilvyi]